MRHRAGRLTALLVLAALVAVSATACRDTGTTAAPACQVAGPVLRDQPYRSVPAGVDPKLISLDVYRAGPGCAHAPVWVWVHGGGWRGGDKANQLTDKIRTAREQGWILVSVNYRLSPGSASAPVAWPVHNDDVAAAVAWVHAHAEGFGGEPERILLAGHSAGAAIVAGVAGDPRYLAPFGLGPSAVRCVAPLDTEGFDVTRVLADAPNPIYLQAFGADPVTWEAASTVRHLASGGVLADQFLVKRGDRARRAGVDAYAAAVEAAGASARVVDVGTYTHEDVNVKLGQAGELVETPAFLAWALSCLARSA